MCRFVAYSGKPILLDELIIKPKNSLIQQSSQAKEANETVNGDGFGLGWYNQLIDEKPAVFNSIRPAWNDLNLINLAAKIQSECFFAHVRAANMGDVAITNCHPFSIDNFLFMHNGLVAGFKTIKRALMSTLSDESFSWIKGQTDSEHLCALFVDQYKTCSEADAITKLTTALINTIKIIEKLLHEHGVTDLSLLNLAVTDGKNIVISRYSTQPEVAANTLYYSLGNELRYHDGVTEMIADSEGEQAIIIASERLTNYQANWQEVPVNHLLIVNEKHELEIRPC